MGGGLERAEHEAFAAPARPLWGFWRGGWATTRAPGVAQGGLARGRRRGIVAPILGWALMIGCVEEREVLSATKLVAPTPRAAGTPRRPPASKFPRVSSCPKELAAIERIDRVLSRGCGPVAIRAGYRLDAGSLTVEPGVELVFDRDAELRLGLGAATKVRIVGEPGAPVVMRGVDGGGWRGIRLYSGADDALLEQVVIEGAGDPDLGALYVESQRVSVVGVTMRAIAGLGIYVRSSGSLARFALNDLEGVATTVAAVLPAGSMAAVSADNRFGADTRLRLLGGLLTASCRWEDPGVPVIVSGGVEVAGEALATLTLAPGLELRFDADGYINVGYYNPGELIAVGSAERPIVMTSTADSRQPGAWRGVSLYKHARARLEGVTMRYGGRLVDRGVLFANGEAEVAIRGCTFQDNAAGVVLDRAEVRLREFSGNSFVGTPRPLTLAPATLGAIGEGCSFGGEAVTLNEGAVTGDARWRDLGAPIEVLGPIEVEGATLTIAAGVELVVHDGFSLSVGRRAPAALKIEGAPARPVKIRGRSERRGTWDAIALYPASHDSSLDHLHLRNAGGEAAVQVLGSASATVTGLRCDRCFAPALTWSCDARIEVGEVLASEGSPPPVASPRCE